MGVIKRKTGKLNISIFLTRPVKHMPSPEKTIPASKATARIHNPAGKAMRPKPSRTANMMAAAMNALVAPQTSSPKIISSMVKGVERMASNVFWKYIRTKEAYVVSKKP